MKKRFTDASKWSEVWFRKLPRQSKALWGYLNDNCDNAGVIELDLELASLDIGEPIQPEHVAALGNRLKALPNGKFWLTDFIRFQYGRLSPDCRPHNVVFESLNHNGIPVSDALPIANDTPVRCEGQKVSHTLSTPLQENPDRLSAPIRNDSDTLATDLPRNTDPSKINDIKGYSDSSDRVLEVSNSPPDTLQDKDKDKEKDKDKDREGGCGGKPEPPPAAPQIAALPPPPVPSLKATHSMDALTVIREGISKAFQRDKNFAWSYAEEYALVEVSRRPQAVTEMAEILASRPRRGAFFPHTIEALLSGWTKAVDAARNGNAPVPARPALPGQQLKAIEDEIEVHPANRESAFYDPKCTDAQRNDLKQLRQKLNQVRSQIARA